MAATALKPAPPPDVPARAALGRQQGGAGADPLILDPTLLLTRGGDGRIMLDEGTGLNRYGCGPRPDGGIAPFGSSTCSTLSAAAHGAVRRLAGRLAEDCAREPRAAVYRQGLDRVRDKLAATLGLTDMAGLKTILSPSGTDVHRIALMLAAAGAATPPLVVLPEQNETGSGIAAALGGRSGPAAALKAMTAWRGLEQALLAPQILAAPCRRADGTLRPTHEVDADVAVIASAAARMGRRVLLVMMDQSKTGLISPSVACAQDLKRRFADQIEVMVDACQLRLAPATLSAYLRQGFLVALTGSKFMTGPAFSGALLVPPAAAERLAGQALPEGLAETCLRGEFPDGLACAPALEDRANLGLLLRWEAALEEMRRFAALPSAAVAALFCDFAAAVAERLADDRAFEPLAARPLERTGLGVHGDWDRQQTIFPFLLRVDGKAMGPMQTLSLQRLMGVDLGDWAGWGPAGRRSQLGQPVACGQRGRTALAALRLCMSARLAADALAPGGRGGAAVIAEALEVLDKAAWLTTRLTDA